jgi:hypothetical protein
MAAYSAWQYSRWIYNIGRSMTITPQSTSENTAVENFINFIYDPATQTGSRPWLATLLNEKAVMPNDFYKGDSDVEPKNIDAKVLTAIARDLKKIAITDAEGAQADILIAATGNRKYGYSN